MKISHRLQQHCLYNAKKAVRKGWMEKMDMAFNELKRRLTSPPVFLNFQGDEPMLGLSIYASGKDMGGVLRQNTPEGPKVIKYVSKKFNQAQKRYSTTERECLAMTSSIQRFDIRKVDVTVTQIYSRDVHSKKLISMKTINRQNVNSISK